MGAKSIAESAEVLRRAASLMREHVDTFSNLITLEMGKLIGEPRALDRIEEASMVIPAPVPAGFTEANGCHTHNGVTIHYVLGGTGEPFLLLHGWPQTRYEWHGIMPKLAERYTVIAAVLAGWFVEAPDGGRLRRPDHGRGHAPSGAAARL